MADMKPFVATTGAVFALLVLVHIWRAVVEPHVLRDVWFWLITLVAAALSVWAWSVLRRAARS
jgi:hypothetical protein